MSGVLLERAPWRLRTDEVKLPWGLPIDLLIVEECDEFKEELLKEEVNELLMEELLMGLLRLFWLEREERWLF